MPRKKISEQRAKTILYGALGQTYTGMTLAADQDWQSHLGGLDQASTYVVKVDQAEKGRFKKGLVLLDRSAQMVAEDVQQLFEKGYSYALVEPFAVHTPEDERYLLLERVCGGVQVSYSSQGGVDIEDNSDSIQTFLYQPESQVEGLPAGVLQTLVETFNAHYLSFLEINPLLVANGRVQLLDAAAEVDSEAVFFEDQWSNDDIRQPLSRTPTPQEQAVQALAEKSQASFSLEVLNPDGRIFLLLSGGGASVVVADEVYNLGHGQELANYGEYSGNPNFEETRIYTEQIVQLLLASKAKHKLLIIGGGVANFTDVRTTFQAIIAALKPHQTELAAQAIKIYVRRGGPHERAGLAAMKEYLEATGLYGLVAGPELVLSDIVAQALKEDS